MIAAVSVDDLQVFFFFFFFLYLWKDSHAYNKGRALVVSKIPLPNYRADLDERHGSTKKEVKWNSLVFDLIVILILLEN